MGVAVPLGVAVEIGEAEVGRQVDDLEVLGQAGDHLLRRAVRQAAEHHVAVVPVGLVDRGHDRQAEAGEMREHDVDRLAGVAVGGQQRDADARMTQQQAQELAPGVAAGAQDTDPDRLLCVHDSSPFRLSFVIRPKTKGASRWDAP
jgi:hypothetical protein